MGGGSPESIVSSVRDAVLSTREKEFLAYLAMEDWDRLRRLIDSLESRQRGSGAPASLLREPEPPRDVQAGSRAPHL